MVFRRCTLLVTRLLWGRRARYATRDYVDYLMGNDGIAPVGAGWGWCRTRGRVGLFFSQLFGVQFTLSRSRPREWNGCSCLICEFMF